MSTKRGVDYLYERLREDGFRAEGIHGDMNQGRREKVMNGFKEGKTSILVASDVAARGIHVEGIELIVNYDEAQDADTHLHRIGRTGRMGEEGRAVTFVETAAEEDKDRNRADHPDFAWMKRSGDPFRRPPGRNFGSRDSRDSRGRDPRGRSSGRYSGRGDSRSRERGPGGSRYGRESGGWGGSGGYSRRDSGERGSRRSSGGYSRELGGGRSGRDSGERPSRGRRNFGPRKKKG
jgi:ATP-dependent RNA helicase DeaD